MEGMTVTRGAPATRRTLISFMATTSSISHGIGGPISRGRSGNTSTIAMVETSCVITGVTTSRAVAPETSSVEV